jgi:hypothetical protein
VDASITEEYPNGLAYIVVEELQKKYLPLDTMTRIELRTELNNICMKRKENPSALFEHIVSIRNRYNQGTYKVSMDDLFAVVMAAAPMEYQAALVAEQCHQGNNLTLDHLCEVMDTLYRQLYGTNRSHGEEGSTEVSLSNFMGTCVTCRKKGIKLVNVIKRKQIIQIMEQ